MTVDPGWGDGDLALSHRHVTALHPSVCGEVTQFPAAPGMASVASVERQYHCGQLRCLSSKSRNPIQIGLKHKAICFLKFRGTGGGRLRWN